MKTWVQPSKPKEIKAEPWLCPRATEFFAGLLKKGMTVMEFGAGGSTLWLAERVRHVYSFENDPDWYSVLRRRKPENVTLSQESFPRDVPLVDLLFIDGEPVELRGEWLRMAKSLLVEGGIVVLDNANRPEYKDALAEFAKDAILFERVVDKALGTQYTVTEFYRCKRV